MAFITITSTTNMIHVDFGVYAAANGIPKKEVFHKNDISFLLCYDESFVGVKYAGQVGWSVNYDGAGENLQIDSVDGVAPTDNAHLYDLLTALIA